MSDNRPPYFAWRNDSAVPPRIEAGPAYDGPAVFIATPDPSLNNRAEREAKQRPLGTPEQEAWVDARQKIEAMGRQMIVVPCPDAARQVAMQEIERRNAPPPIDPPDPAPEASQEFVARAMEEAIASLGVEDSAAWERFQNEVENAALEIDMGITPEDPPELGLGAEPSPPSPDASPGASAKDLPTAPTDRPSADSPEVEDRPSPGDAAQNRIVKVEVTPGGKEAWLTPGEAARMHALRVRIGEGIKEEAKPSQEKTGTVASRAMESFPHPIQKAVDAPLRPRGRRSPRPGPAPPGAAPSIGGGRKKP